MIYFNLGIKLGNVTLDQTTKVSCKWRRERWRRNKFSIRTCTKQRLTFCTVNTTQLLLIKNHYIGVQINVSSFFQYNTLQVGHTSDKWLLSVHRHLTCIYIGKINTFLCHTILSLVTSLILMQFLWKKRRVVQTGV